MLFELDEKLFYDHIKKHHLVLIKFGAPWCRSCEALEDLLEELSEDLFDLVKIFEVNVENTPSVADEFDVFTLPTMILFKDGKEYDRKTGLHKIDTIKEWILHV
ncbi:thioredoxin family protein [Acholeplasma equifetale]|jgi:thioredoxin 1|uniref:thioredoxin family protein n=1 Tax=Acholeplasma equifetale TaxID=264634 RepID=UPI00138AC1CD|nr:thioredoxin family protein [Acholeplasma equifetale]HHY96721.1 thioredoxin family protein [Acholeplasma sp.]